MLWKRRSASDLGLRASFGLEQKPSQGGAAWLPGAPGVMVNKLCKGLLEIWVARAGADGKTTLSAPILGNAQFLRPRNLLQAGRFSMAFSSLIIVSITLSLAGCGKQSKATSGKAEPAATDAAAAPAPSVPKATPRYDVGNGQVDLEALNKKLRDYVRLTKVIPNELNELVTSGYLSRLPAPPPGKKFVIKLHPLGYLVVLEDE